MAVHYVRDGTVSVYPHSPRVLGLTEITRMARTGNLPFIPVRRAYCAQTANIPILQEVFNDCNTFFKIFLGFFDFFSECGKHAETGGKP